MKYTLLFNLSLIFSFGLLGQTVLDTAVVSASLSPQSLESTNRSVIIIEEQEIKDAAVQSISELLDFAVGMDSRQRGTYGTQTDLSIRGGSFEQVLVLVNGVRLSDAQTGHHLMNLPVVKEDIERIEILLGGGSYIFGGSAFSGAINIITKKADKDQFKAQIEGGSYGSFKATASQSFIGESHTTRVSASTASSDGFKRNTDFTTNNLNLSSAIKTSSDGLLNIQGGYTDQAFGAQDFYSTNFPEQFEKTQTLFANISYESGDRLKIKRELYWRRNWDEFQLYRESDDFYTFQNGLFISSYDTAAAWYGGHNYHRSDMAGGKLSMFFKSALGSTAMNAEYRYEGVVSNVLGQDLEAPIEIAGSRGQYTNGANRRNLSFALEQSKRLKSFDIQAALLINHNTDYSWDALPSINLGYKWNKFKIYSSFNKSFRMPSYTDLYYNLGGAVGSQDLNPEYSYNYEIGTKYFGANYTAGLSIFRRNGQDIIDWIRVCDTCDLEASNTTEVNMNGVEAFARFGMSERLQKYSLNSIQIGFSYLFSDGEDPDYASLYVYDYLKYKVTAQLSHSFKTLKGLGFSYGLSLQERNGTYTDVNGLEAAYETVLLINAKLAYQYEDAQLFIQAQNLLDKSYFDRANVELPGLWITIGLAVGF